MTSVNLRKPQKLTFPASSTSRRLSRIDKVEGLGLFSIDKVTIVLEVPWRDEDILGTKSKPKAVISKKNGERVGFIIFCHHKGHAFQIFRHRGQNRNLQFNPRHFRSLSEFIVFVNLIIDGRKYHISRVDFAWFLYKPLLSVVFLYWSVFFKGPKLSGKYDYKVEGLKLLQKGSFQGFSYGTGDYRGKAYDTDEFNTAFHRRSDRKIHGCINFEVSIGGDRLRKIGISKLADLERLTDFKFVLERIKFCKPQKNIFRKKKFKELEQIWREQGATEMCRSLYKKSGTKNYNILREHLRPLKIQNMSFKKALLALAASDYEKFKNGCSFDNRKQTRNYNIDMEPIFKFTQQP